MMWWAVWCVVVVAGSSLAAASPAPAPDSIPSLEMVQIDPSGPDDDTLGYAVQPMSRRFSASAPWLYLLTDMPHDSQVSKDLAMRSRRSFTVNPAIELLQRGAYLNFVGRVVQDNRDYLNKVGKRAHWSGPGNTGLY